MSGRYALKGGHALGIIVDAWASEEMSTIDHVVTELNELNEESVRLEGRLAQMREALEAALPLHVNACSTWCASCAAGKGHPAEYCDARGLKPIVDKIRAALGGVT